MLFKDKKDIIAAAVYKQRRTAGETLDTGYVCRRFLRISIMLKNVPLAPNPKRAILITMNDRWFHCPMENTRVSKTSKARLERDTKKMALRSIVGIG